MRPKKLGAFFIAFYLPPPFYTLKTRRIRTIAYPIKYIKKAAKQPAISGEKHPFKYKQKACVKILRRPLL